MAWSAVTTRSLSIRRVRISKPERVPATGAPGSIYNSINLARDEANRTSGMNEASQGIAPAGVSAGRALLALQEQDDTRLGTSVQMAEAEYGRWGTMVLGMARRFYDEPRKYAITGDVLSGSIFFFDRSDMKDTADVICQPNSAMPKNKYAQQDAVLGFFQAGVLGDPASEETRIKARRMLEFGQKDDFHDDDAQDEAVAEKENVAMVSMHQQISQQLQGQMQQAQMMGIDPMVAQQMYQQALMQAVMPVERWDMHLVHLRVHLRRFRQPGVRDNPDMANIIKAHMDQHVQAMQPPAPPPMPGTPGSQPGGSLPPEMQAQQQIAMDQGQQPGAVATQQTPQGGTMQNSKPDQRDQQILPSDFQ